MMVLGPGRFGRQDYEMDARERGAIQRPNVPLHDGALWWELRAVLIVLDNPLAAVPI